jgi:L-fuconolactonase
MHSEDSMDPDVEAIIEPELPIVDSHHHLWYLPEAELRSMEQQENIVDRALVPTFRSHSRYLFDEFLLDLKSGHNIQASVFVDAHAMYRAGGAEAMRSVGEVEFANGVAAMAASGLFGDTRVCAGIVGGVDLTLGSAADEVLRAHLAAGGARYRGVRSPVLYDEDGRILGDGGRSHLLLDATFREGFKCLQPLGLSFDALLLEPQLPDLIDLARAFPETTIILNHVGAPVGIGRYAGQREQRFSLWAERIRTLAGCANVVVKLGGFGTPFAGFETCAAATSSQLADIWRPYVMTCIEAFGPQRCMFESNFPVDASACSYSILWNAFKRIAAGASRTEKTALFSATATSIYRLDL